MNMLNEKEIYEILSEIPDPEIPVITIKDLGILQRVELKDGNCEVYITPTYSGCPAMKLIEDQIKEALVDKNVGNIIVKLVYAPTWTTDWITPEAKEKLRKYGIAPPLHSSVDKGILIGKAKILKCPQCGTQNTEMISQFGSTACKALYKCLDCKEPFDYFKCI
jgi:ring-1,2-phenylacetyl-CoA epoxidase subunit PaaD